MIPVIPYLVLDGTTAFIVSLALSLAALFLVGAGVSLLTGRGVLFSGLRQLGIGAAAAAVTFAVGPADRRRRRAGRRVAADPRRADRCGPRASTRAPGPTARAIATRPTPMATTRSWSARRVRSGSACPTSAMPSTSWPGDRLDLPAGTSHDAVVGPDGVTCLEAHLPAGRLPALARRPAGSW